jgi:hypothetical protein
MFDGFWYTYDDIPAGGSSKVWPPADQPFIMTECGRKKGTFAAGLKGSVTKDFEFGFIGMGYYMSPANVRKSFDLGNHKTISFWHKGDGGVYRVKIVSTHEEFINKDSDNQYGFDFKTGAQWQEIVIPFTSMSQQPGWGSKVELNKALLKIKEIQFMTLDRPLKSVELLIDTLRII